MKKPWYVWASIFGFVWLWGSLTTRVNTERPRNQDKWNRLCGTFFLLFFCGFMLPTIPMLLIHVLISDHVSYFWGEMFLFVVYAQVYICGVFITNRLHKWSIKNL